MQYRFLLAGVLILAAIPVSDSNLLPEEKFYPKHISFHFSEQTAPFWKLGKHKDIATDTAVLKQSSWYAEAMKRIEEMEYEIRYDAAIKTYASPNRRQNLRSFYSGKKFTLQERDNHSDNWLLELTTKGVFVNNRLLYSPDEKAGASQNGNSIRFNHSNFYTEYINSKEGIRQNFIIEKEPASKPACPAGRPQTVSIRLQANDGWFIHKVHGKEIHFAKANGEAFDKKITYNDLKVWDARNKELVSSFSVVQNQISIDVETVNALYPITIDPLSTTPSVQLESNQATAYFGCSVASAGDVNGDGYSDVIAGAYNFDNGNNNEGAAFIFHGSSTGISATIQTQLEGGQDNAQFGTSVSTAGDVNGDGYSDVIIGAQYATNGQSFEGAAYVYHGSSTGITNTIQTLLECNQASASMGRSVAAAGDVNGDGYSDVIVGALQFDNGNADEGAAFIFHGSASGITPAIQAQLEGNQNNARYGVSVSSAGNVNGDAYSDVIVGAEYFDNGNSNEGAAFIYHGSASGITLTIQTQLECGLDNAQLGHSVSGAGDVNGDGYSDVIAGAWNYTNGQSQEGAFFVYHGSGTGITTTVQASLEGNQNSVELGYSVSTAGDVNGDGYSDVMVGAPQYTNGQTYEGGTFVYLGSASGINTGNATQLESNQAFARMGYSVAAAGDVNGDGYSDMIVGAYLYDNGQTDEGAAFVYHGSSGGVSNSPNSIADDANQANAYLGWSVASAGDVNADGYSDVIIGAIGYDAPTISNEGRVFVYHGGAAGLSANPNTLLDDADQFAAGFGFSVASAGDVNGDGFIDIIIGAKSFDDAPYTNEGRAYVYHGSSGGVSLIPNSILDDADQSNAYFGTSVASAGDVNGDGYSDVIVGASGAFAEGRAYVYYGGAGGLSATPDNILDDAGQMGSLFGESVSGAGDINGDGYLDVIVGAPGFTDGANNFEGRAFVYYGSNTGLLATPGSIPDDADQGDANFGQSVACAGDVNGDGFSDVIIGVPRYNDGINVDEGVAFIYYGGTTGLSASPNSVLDDADQADARFGTSVASAGDVNGDGYSDVVVGAPMYTDGANTWEGRAFVYHGSSTGLVSIPNNTPNDAGFSDAYGTSVACAGDVNGDGYSDLVVGAPYYDDGVFTQEGGAFVYLGNNGGGLRNNLRLYNQDLVTPIQQLNVTEPNLFGTGLFTKSPLGRVKGKLVWEVKKQGVPFSGNPITTSTAFLDKQSSFSDLGIAGVELKSNVQKVGSRNNKVRTRVEYDKATAITGQVYGPWRYPAGYTMGAYGMNSVPLPITLISFNGQFINAADVQLKWITSNEINMQTFIVERSTDGINFTEAGELAAKGVGSSRADYSFMDKNVQHELLYYRLKLKEISGDLSYTKTITLSRSKIVRSFIAPNPVMAGVDAVLNIHASANSNSVAITMYNMQGQLVLSANRILQSGRNQVLLSTTNLASGMYVVNVSGNGTRESYRLIVQ